ncbi:hypothetical protein [Bradyrhizobium niftali]|jgi:hypothetical protein|uniref:Uncharacterized protein n=1 Tax=Bradyrhizobium niftali TaxID=2560055 RepID=A0A4Y9LSM9_9BRAD|nr:hypothetical protein [Bradyrhizobium niftali]TFV45063.1 hypothetical protein E4K65_26340 [Bradyrhizobium niftali]
MKFSGISAKDTDDSAANLPGAQSVINQVNVDGPAIAGPLHQTRRPKTAAERQRACRQRKRQQRQIALAAVLPEVLQSNLPVTSADKLAVAADATLAAPAAITPTTLAVALPATADVTSVAPSVALSVAPSVALPVLADVSLGVPDVTLPVTAGVTPSAPAVTLPVTAGVTPVTLSHVLATRGRWVISHCLTAVALVLCGVAIAMNGLFAQSLASTDRSGRLFLALGVAADLVVHTVPSTAAQIWRARKRITAAAAWLVWLIASVFAFIGSIGFASINVTDVTLARASRVTPAVTTARAALDDAITARNRECAGGVGRFCHEREKVVTERQRALDAALSSVEQASDPQSDAAIKIVAWISAGKLKPTAEDFNMLRLVLLALLPQLGGVLLMIAGRARRNSQLVPTGCQSK